MQDARGRGRQTLRQGQEGAAGEDRARLQAAMTPVPASGEEGDAERTAVFRTVSPGSRDDAPGLLLVSAPAPGLVGTWFALEAPEVLVGRGEAVGIRLDDPGVSREHLRIRRRPSGELVAEDLDSTNGTWLNGVAVRSAALSEGDRLQLGTSTELLFGTNRSSVQAEIRLRQAVSAAGAGTWEWFVSSGALQVYGGVARAVGREAETTAPRAEDCWPRVHPDDRAALRGRLEATLRQGGAFEAEVRLLRPDGSAFQVALSGEPFRDATGRTVRVAGALLDVSERRLADAELRRQSLLFDSLAEAVVIVGPGGTILDWSASAERLLGWSKAEALGLRPGALLLRQGAERLDAALVDCARRGTRHAEELVLRARSGAEVPVELATVPLVGRDEALVACVAMFRDLGERRRLQARLDMAERLASLGTLAAGVAHEINNPLAFVTSNLDYVARQLGPGHADLAEALADCRKGAERIAAIVRDLQAFSVKGRPGASEEVDPNAALEFALRMAAGHLRQRARLVRQLEPVPRVRGGEARLGQVFLNLLVNATQAIEPGRAEETVIRVASRHDRERGRVVVEIADEGPGIPPDVLPRIFEPFFTTKPVGAGTGLGLFVCQGIVRDLGGELEVESEPGRGTTFRVLLPALPAGAAVPAARRRVLVVDDEPLLGAALKRCLADRFEVVAVTDPREALARVRAGERYAFAVVDLQMPQMSGQELLDQLRQVDPQLARRAVAVTGGPLGEAAQRFGDGARPTILAKPLDLARLRALLDAAADEDARA